MGNSGSKKDASLRKMDSATALEEQWMDPHKRKVLAAVEDTVQKCRDGVVIAAKTPDVLKSIRLLCSVIYSANDFELIQKCQETFPSLVATLLNPSTSATLRLEIVSAVSVLCQGNQVNCRSWCAAGGVKALLAQLGPAPSPEQTDDPLLHPTLQLNVWLIYTMRTLMCGSPAAIKAVLASAEWARTAEVLVKMCELRDVWQRTAEQHNYALDCCILLGIAGGLRKPQSP